MSEEMGGAGSLRRELAASRAERRLDYGRLLRWASLKGNGGAGAGVERAMRRQVESSRAAGPLSRRDEQPRTAVWQRSEAEP